MRELTCQEIDELLAAYAVDALESDEREAVEHHVAECRRHDAELALYRSVTEQLPGVLAPVSPPPAVRSRLLDAFDNAVAGREEPEAPRRLERWRFLRAPSFAYGLAAALLVVALGLGAWGIARGDGESDILVRTVETANQRLELVYLPERQVAVFDFALPPLPAGQTYQAWQITGGAPVSLGLMSGSSGVAAFEVDLSGASAVAISQEPAGGSATPTTVVLVSEL
jgi:anti-sigma-K factor RskA